MSEEPAFEPRILCYGCQACSTVTVTRQIDDGVTAFIIPCPECGGPAMHFGTDGTEFIYGPPTREWFRRAPDDAMNRDLRDHIERGGLDLREIPK